MASVDHSTSGSGANATDDCVPTQNELVTIVIGLLCVNTICSMHGRFSQRWTVGVNFEQILDA